jgi:hypothetical protein
MASVSDSATAGASNSTNTATIVKSEVLLEKYGLRNLVKAIRHQKHAEVGRLLAAANHLSPTLFAKMMRFHNIATCPAVQEVFAEYDHNLVGTTLPPPMPPKFDWTPGRLERENVDHFCRFLSSPKVGVAPALAQFAQSAKLPLLKYDQGWAQLATVPTHRIILALEFLYKDIEPLIFFPLPFFLKCDKPDKLLRFVQLQYRQHKLSEVVRQSTVLYLFLKGKLCLTDQMIKLADSGLVTDECNVIILEQAMAVLLAGKTLPVTVEVRPDPSMSCEWLEVFVAAETPETMANFRAYVQPVLSPKQVEQARALGLVE